MNTDAENQILDTDRADVAIALFEDGSWLAAGDSGESLHDTVNLLYRRADALGKVIKDVHIAPWVF